MTQSIWILTQAVNDYNQHGNYFIACWLTKPTANQLLENSVLKHELTHVLNGGGRLACEDVWYYLEEHLA